MKVLIFTVAVFVCLLELTGMAFFLIPITFIENRIQWDGWSVRVLRPFISISVISRRWKGEYEMLCAMKRRLGSGRISPPAGFEPATPRSEVGSANRSATRTLRIQWVFYNNLGIILLSIKKS